MKSILFVDDEPRILSALARMLRSQRRAWDMVFAEGGAEALEQLAGSPVDVVVSDARMPGMDGVRLLGEVRRRYPDAARIILSGQCSRDSVLECVGVAHQFLTKPCDAEVLIATLRRVCQLRDELVDGPLRQTVTGVDSLPSRHAAVAELATEVDRPEPSTSRLARIVARDVGMSVRLLQLVNSGFFGTPQRVADPGAAVELLGLDTIRDLVRSESALLISEPDAASSALVESLNERALKVAGAARRIAESMSDDAGLAAQAYTSGLLHQVGALALARSVSGANALSEPPEEGSAGTEPDSAPVDRAGSYLVSLWGLPEPIARAIACHRHPARSGETTFGPVTALHVARALAAGVADPAAADAGPDMADLEAVGCADRLEHWRRLCETAEPVGALP